VVSGISNIAEILLHMRAALASHTRHTLKPP
jgi:hypothetical protein